jgi:hypothetical protein
MGKRSSVAEIRALPGVVQLGIELVELGRTVAVLLAVVNVTGVPLCW